MKKLLPFISESMAPSWLDKYQGGGNVKPLIGYTPNGDIRSLSGVQKRIPVSQEQLEQNAQDNVYKQKRQQLKDVAALAFNQQPVSISQYTPQQGDAKRRAILAQQYADLHGGYVDDNGGYHEGLVNEFARSKTADRIMNNLVDPMITTAGVIDGADLIGAGLKEGFDYLPQVGKYLTEETPLKNTYKINPWAEKLNNPNLGYRIADQASYNDYLNSGVVRSKSAVPGWRENVTTSLQEAMADRPTGFPSFAKGSPAFDYLPEEGPGYIYSTDIPLVKRGEVNPVTGKIVKGRHWAYRPIDSQTGDVLKEIPANNIKVYNGQPNWLSGYKELSGYTSPTETTFNANILRKGPINEPYTKIAEHANNTINTEGRNIMKDLMSKEGTNRLAKQFKLALPNATDEQINYLVDNRLSEVKTALDKNKNIYYLKNGKGAAGTPTFGKEQELMPFGNASYSSKNPDMSVYSSNISPINVDQYFPNYSPNQFGSFASPKYRPGTITLGPGHENSIETVNHEVAHALQGAGTNDVLPLEKDLVELAKQKTIRDRIWFAMQKRNNPNFIEDYDYFINSQNGTNPREPYPFLAENRSYLKNQGLLNNTYDVVTADDLLKYKQLGKNSIVKDPNRLLKLYPKWKIPELANIWNVAPAVVPAVGVATAAALANQDTSKQKYGGWLDQYADGGVSIVDYLASKGQDFDRDYRKQLAQKEGISDYDFSAQKNLELLAKLRSEESNNKKVQPSIKQIPVKQPNIIQQPALDYNFKNIPNSTYAPIPISNSTYVSKQIPVNFKPITKQQNNKSWEDSLYSTLEPIRNGIDYLANYASRVYSKFHGDDDSSISKLPNTPIKQNTNKSIPIDTVPPIMMGDTLWDNKKEGIYHSPEVIDLKKTKFGYRDRGDLTPVKSNGFIFGVLGKEKPMMNSDDKRITDNDMYVTIDPEGNIAADYGKNIKGTNKRAAFFHSHENVTGFAKDKNNQYKLQNASDAANGYYFPLFNKEDKTVSGTPGLLMRNQKDANKYGSISGGHMIISSPDLKKQIVVSGSVKDIDNQLEKFKKDNNLSKVTVIQTDNGSFSRNFRTANGTITSDQWKQFQNRNVKGSSGFYLKGRGYAEGGVITDPMGQWAHPGSITRIPSNDITMKGVNYPLLGISNTGHTQMMYPGKDYKFHGSSVTEYPMMQKGGKIPIPLPEYIKKGNAYVDSFNTNGYTQNLLARLKFNDKNINRDIEDEKSQITNLHSNINPVGYKTGITSKGEHYKIPLYAAPSTDPSNVYQPQKSYWERLKESASNIQDNISRNIDNAVYNTADKIHLADTYLKLQNKFDKGTKYVEHLFGNDDSKGNINGKEANTWNNKQQKVINPIQNQKIVNVSKPVQSVGNVRPPIYTDNSRPVQPYILEQHKPLTPGQIVPSKLNINEGNALQKVPNQYIRGEQYNGFGARPMYGEDNQYIGTPIESNGMIRLQGQNGDVYGQPISRDEYNQYGNTDASLRSRLLPKQKNGGGLLSKSVTCSNCGWSWKATDGGSDPLTCHKCGGTIKMKNGGWLDNYN
jgi:hypothetical protein